MMERTEEKSMKKRQGHCAIDWAKKTRLQPATTSQINYLGRPHKA